MVTIKNEYLTASFDEKGAELKSLVCSGNEFIWQGDEKFWTGSAPVLFPICSGLKDNTYYLSGKEYHLNKHGFAKNMIFAVESKAENTVTFLLTDTPDTQTQYPYRFEFRIIYTLSVKTLSIRYEIRNPDGKQMYFSVGAHEAYSCPDGIENYDIVMPQKQTLVSTTLTGPNTLGYEELTVTNNSDILPLKYKYFDVDALVFLDFKGDYVILKNRNTKKEIKVTFKDFPYLLLWTKPDAPYICIEPWCGISDRDDTDGQFETKQGICHIKDGETFVREHTIEIL